MTLLKTNLQRVNQTLPYFLSCNQAIDHYKHVGKIRAVVIVR
jgi:hypothetical protein